MREKNYGYVTSKLFMMLIFILCSVELGYANSAEPLRYWHESGTHYISGSKSLTLSFYPNEMLCKATYGNDNGYKVCTRNVGDILPAGKDIRLEPPHPGSWKWTDDTSLRFYPAKVWPVGQKYTVYIGEKSLPKHTIITGDTTFRTTNLKSKVYGSFKFDPNQYKNMKLTGTINFNYPIVHDSVREHFSIEIVGNDASSLLLGEAEVTMHANNQTLYYSIPILQLPTKAVDVRISMNRGYRPEFGGKLGTSSENTIQVPAKGSMLKVESIDTQILDMPDLSAKQTLNIELSMPVLPKNLKMKMKAYLMPRQRIDSEALKDKAPFEWWNLQEMNSEFLKKAQSLNLIILNDPNIPTRFISFAVEEPIEDYRYLYLHIGKNLQGPEDYLLATPMEVFLKVLPLRSNLKIMQTGSVLNLKGDKKISLYARNLDEIQYKIYQIRPEYLNMYVSSFGLRNGGNGNISLAELSVVSDLDTKLLLKNSEKAQFTSLDLAPFLAKQPDSIFYISIEGKLKNQSVANDSRFIMLTDLGIIRKKNADGSSYIYVTSLQSGMPLVDVKIEVLGQNGIDIYKGLTNEDGMLRIPSLSTYRYEQEPSVIVAKQKKDLAYIPYSQHSNIVDISRSDTGGKRGARDGMYGFVFNQRDIYKPGETAHFGFILKQGEFDASTQSALPDIPVDISIYDSKNKRVESKRIKLNPNGFGEMSYLIPSQAITGSYRIGISMTDSSSDLLTKNFQVEEFEPDTLRLEAKFDLLPKKGWYLPKELKNLNVTATLMNLFGAAAVDHLITGEVTTRRDWFIFREYKDWNFYDAARLERPKEYSFIGINSDANGLANFTIPTPLFEQETSALHVTMRGFNAAGSRSVMQEIHLMTSPLEAVVGWKNTANLDYIPQDTAASLEIMAIDSFLEPFAFGDFTIEYYAVDYVRSLVKNPRGEYVYRNERKETLVESKQLNLTEKTLKWNLDTQTSGEKLLIAKDANKRIILQIPYTVAGESLLQFGEMNTADLQVKLNKSHYEANEEIEIYMHLPYDGAGLITIERENVLSQEWFKAKRGERIQKITIPKTVEGRAYLNVLYFRDSKDADIFTEPFASMVVPFTANLEKRELDLTLDILDTGVNEGDSIAVVRPGTNLQVKLASTTPSKVIVFAVDEGILQMTGYTAPDPIYELLVDRALEVSTYQYFDLLMPEYGVLGTYLSKFGGDLMLRKMNTGMMAENTNPFRRKGIKSVAFWSGLVDVDSDGTIIDIPVPATFNGQLRIMAVGVSDDKMNSVQKHILARSEVVIQPSIPYFVAPGDEFVANLTLIDMAKMGEKDRQWKLSIENGKGLKLLNDNNITITLTPQKQKTISLRFKALTPDGMSEEDRSELLGNQDIHFNLSNGKSTISMPISLSVRPAVALQNDIHLGQLPKRSIDYGKYIELTNNWYPQLSKLSVSMSPIPKSIIQGIVERLRERRYHCTPIRLSADFPLLAIMKNPQFALTPSQSSDKSSGEYSNEGMGEDVARVIQMLANRYSNDSHFTMWPSGYGRSSVLDNVYIADFLVEAQNMGISLPYTLRNNFLRALESTISRMPNSMNEARSFAYGAWVLTQNGVITSNVMSNLVSWLDKNNDAWEKDIIAPLMAASMDLMMEENIAKRLLSGYSPDPNSAWSWSTGIDALGERALYLSIIAKQFPEQVNIKKVTDTVNQIVALISSKQYRSMSAALAARSLIFYSIAQENKTEEASTKAVWSIKFFDDSNKIVLSDGNGNGIISEASIKAPLNASVQSDDGILISKIESMKMDSNMPLYYHVNLLGYPVDIPTESTSSGLELSREYRDLDGNILSELTMGDDIIVAIKARVRSESSHDVVITDLLPASLELILAEGGKMNHTGTQEGRAMLSVNDNQVDQMEDNMRTLYVDRREDRMIIYATLDNNETVFRYRARVAHKGEFVIPPIQGEGLQNPTIQALTLMEFGKNKDFMLVQ